jgi:bifunctional ADP-heptose synthase (sugar kinase/adenylyltransferase)
MDTRTKIVSFEDALDRIEARLARGDAVRVVTGHFDPLLRAHARRLEEIAASDGRPVVVITEPACPLLPAEARAVLVAALDAVELVTLAPPAGLTRLVDLVPRGRLLRGEEEDLRLRADFMRLVRDRCAAG